MSVNEAFFVAETGQYHGDVYACVYIRTNSWLLLILLLRRFILDGSIGASKKTRGRTRPFRLDTRLQQREFFFNAPSDPLVLSMVLFWTLFLTILNCRIRMQIEFEKFSKTIILPHYHPPLQPPVLSNYQDRVTPNQLLSPSKKTLLPIPEHDHPKKLTCASCAVQPPRLGLGLGPSPTIKRRDRWPEKRLTLVTRVLLSRGVWITCSISLQNRASAEITT